MWNKSNNGMEKRYWGDDENGQPVYMYRRDPDRFTPLTSDTHYTLTVIALAMCGCFLLAGFVLLMFSL